ncbi:hypothetical protein BJV82DRAFT_349454 [Fennellomyces sp. T-0311]|nr:hypothetical protein BJV82DRAFT_349454 [Fennellomyces sp. T-0311]
MDVQSFGTLFNDISQVVKSKGISFHARETAVMTEEAREHCIYGTEVYKSDKPTLTHHFNVKTPFNETQATKHRREMFQSLLQREQADRQRSSVSPTTPTARAFPSSVGPSAKRQAVQAPQGGLFVPRQRPVRPPAARAAPGSSSLFNTRPQTRPPMPGAPPGSSSMFIPSRKNSLGAARPPAIRTVVPPTSASAAPTTPKGFQKQSRVQMLDFNESTKMLQDNNRNIDEAEKNLKAQKEQQKHENALRRQAVREEEARWKASARASKRQRTDSVSTSREQSSEPPSPGASRATSRKFVAAKAVPGSAY